MDITSGTPVAVDTAPMRYGRAWAQSTVLPTGHVAVTGGSLNNNQDGANTVLQSEIWNPATGQWSVGASGAVYRGYHSTAILMQTAPSLSPVAGSGPGEQSERRGLLPTVPVHRFGRTTALAPRPSIVSLTSISTRLRSVATVRTEFSERPVQVVLVGLSVVTHSFQLGVSGATWRISASPARGVGADACLRGHCSSRYYQLIAIDKNGVPSPGVIIGLGGARSGPGDNASRRQRHGRQCRRRIVGWGRDGTGGTVSTGNVPTWPTSTASCESDRSDGEAHLRCVRRYAPREQRQ